MAKGSNQFDIVETTESRTSSTLRCRNPAPSTGLKPPPLQTESVEQRATRPRTAPHAAVRYSITLITCPPSEYIAQSGADSDWSGGARRNAADAAAGRPEKLRRGRQTGAAAPQAARLRAPAAAAAARQRQPGKQSGRVRPGGSVCPTQRYPSSQYLWPTARPTS